MAGPVVTTTSPPPPSADSPGPYGFSAANCTRVKRAVDRLERMSQGGGPPPRARAGSAWNPCGYFFLTPGGGIPAMSGTTPGKATCRRWDYNDSDVLVDSNVDISVYNGVTTAVGGGKYVIALWVQGRWTVVMEPC